MNLLLDRQLIIKLVSAAAITMLLFLHTACSPETAVTTTALPETAIPEAGPSQTPQPAPVDPLPQPTSTIAPQDTPTTGPETAAGDTETAVTNSIRFGQTKLEAFSLSTANQIPPQDVLREILFTSGAGGGGGCFGSFAQPEILHQSPPETEAELHDQVELYVCGWQPDKAVQITVTYPNGEVALETMQTSGSDGFLHFYFKTNVLDDPPGLYQITFSGQSGTIVYPLNLMEPPGSRIYWNDDNSLTLYNFAPEETVRIFAYSGSRSVIGTSMAELQAWQAFQVDQDGNLQLLLDVPGNWFTALGDISGQVTLDYISSPRTFGTSGGSILPSHKATPTQPFWPVSETGVEACHLSPGDTATAATNARLWSEPDVTTGSALSSPAVGQQLTVNAGPTWGRIRRDIDASGWWWQVTIPDGQQGWLWQERIQECIN